MQVQGKASQQPTVSCGDIITDSDGDDNGLWCVPMKTTTKQVCQLHSHEAFANVMGLVQCTVCFLQADTFLARAIDTFSLASLPGLPLYVPRKI